MNYRLLSKLLGVVAVLIGATMIFSLPWAHPALGHRTGEEIVAAGGFERGGFLGLAASMVACLAVGAGLMRLGRGATGQLFRKEAMAVVGLSWVLATVLGALPFYFSGTCTGPDVRMTFVDALFESQSGFSTTGATVLTDLEDPSLVPHCILFWRSSTHFLGGLGIIVLFVAILGQGSAGKALMRAEMPGPSKEGSHARMQHTAWIFATIYLGLNLALTVLLCLFGLSVFDGLCHAFGTMATGGFSTYNASVGHFVASGHPSGIAIEYTIIVFMVLAGTNFTLLYLLLIARPRALFRDVEWRTYMAVIVAVAAVLLVVGMAHDDFADRAGQTAASQWMDGMRHSLFQVISITTTTGYGTHDFDAWNNFARATLLLLMFVGGCAGSTGGGMKVIRHILFAKVLRLELEQSFRPSVVRPLRLGGNPVDDPNLRKNVLFYFGLILAIFTLSWLFVVGVEPDATWGGSPQNKLIDSASAVAATLNNIGPGLGTVGATRNYAHMAPASKVLFIWLMMIGRLEIFSIFVLIIPSFWRNR